MPGRHHAVREGLGVDVLWGRPGVQRGLPAGVVPRHGHAVHGAHDHVVLVVLIVLIVLIVSSSSSSSSSSTSSSSSSSSTTSTSTAFCPPGIVSCDADTSTCECEGTGCCGTNCQTKHSNGLGQVFYDCAPLFTYNETQAMEACAAWEGGSAQFCQVTTCGTGNDSVFGTMPSGACALWRFSGTNAGHVVLSSSGCACPAPTDPTWT